VGREKDIDVDFDICGYYGSAASESVEWGWQVGGGHYEQRLH
jgi:hypothetical protein